MTIRAIRHKKSYKYEVYMAYLLIKSKSPDVDFIHCGLKHKKIKGIVKRTLRHVRRMDKKCYNYLMHKLLEMKKEEKK